MESKLGTAEIIRWALGTELPSADKNDFTHRNANHDVKMNLDHWND